MYLQFSTPYRLMSSDPLYETQATWSEQETSPNTTYQSRQSETDVRGFPRFQLQYSDGSYLVQGWLVVDPCRDILGMRGWMSIFEQGGGFRMDHIKI